MTLYDLLTLANRSQEHLGPCFGLSICEPARSLFPIDPMSMRLKLGRCNMSRWLVMKEYEA